VIRKAPRLRGCPFNTEASARPRAQISDVRSLFFMSFFVYILYSEKLDRYYTGTTDNVQVRLHEHNTALYPENFSVKGIPWELFLEIGCSSSQQAYKLEAFIKRMKSKTFIKKLKEKPDLIEDILIKISQ
jgi:putative endonuclease